MNAIISAKKIYHEFLSSIHASELNSLFTSYEDKITILSLDCFDTLIWRKTATPLDVFFDMQNKPAFKALGYSATLRTSNEEKARKLSFIKQKTYEVDLNDIYLHSYPYLNQDQLAALTHDEISTDIAFCYAFKPVVDLMRLAKQKNKTIIIVSDTYYNKKQMKYILSSLLPADVMDSIDDIFCSSDYKVSKSLGHFHNVIKKYLVSPQSILHIGDNKIADVDAARKLEINAIQLAEKNKTLSQLARMRVWAAGFIDQDIRHDRPLIHPFHGLFSQTEFDEKKAETAIGYVTLGPIMYAFARFIAWQVEQIAQNNKSVKVLFLMRDGYLPSQAFQTLYEMTEVKRIYISRFSSYAASFVTQADVEKYLSDTVYSGRFEDICRQLLLPTDVVQNILNSLDESPRSIHEFIKLILQDCIIEIILQQSFAYRERLLRYFYNTLGIQTGDTVLFVDLGYTGTAQKCLAPILKANLNVDVQGCYLIAFPSTHDQLTRKGLLDNTHCDPRALTMLVNHIAIFEQLCTANEASVMDYDNDGKPIFADMTIKKQQHQHLDKIQSECLRFIKEARNFISSHQLLLDFRELSDIAMIELARFIYLPTEQELNYLASFQFDFNLGTKKLFDIFDLQKGLSGLKERGLFFMERNLNKMRMSYPAELRANSLELAFTLMSFERYKGEIIQADLSFRRQKINVIIISGTHSTRDSIEAQATYDGYYSLIVPIGHGQFQIGIQFGLNYRWLQIDKAELIQTFALLSNCESEYTQDVYAHLIPDQMVERSKGLFECETETSFLAFIPPASLNSNAQLLRLIFRPVAFRI